MDSSRLTNLSKFGQSESSLIEPGLLSAFRMIVLLQLALTVIGFVVALLLRKSHGFIFREFPFFIFVPLLTLSLFVLYLSWADLQKRLGKWFLPIGLSAYALQVIVIRILLVQQLIAAGIEPLSEQLLDGSGWRLFVDLLIPLVLVAWQYDFRAIGLYVLSVTTLTLTSGLFILPLGSPLWLDLIMLNVTTAVVFLAIGYIVTSLMSAQRKQRAALAEANAQLTTYASKVEQLSISHERNRLARELHDTLAHTLSAVAIQLEAVDSAWDAAPGKAREILHKSLVQTRTGLTETRRALRALRASPLDDLGLALAIRTLAEATATRSHLALDLSVPDIIEQISPQNEQSIYRIAQEALANVAKHSAADRVGVSLVERENDLLLEIADNGRGFDSTQLGSDDHYGIRGMLERASMMGATVDISGIPDHGTTVQLIVNKEKMVR